MLLIDELLLKNNHFGRNMLKNALFLLKNSERLGALPPDPQHPVYGENRIQKNSSN